MPLVDMNALGGNPPFPLVDMNALFSESLQCTQVDFPSVVPTPHCSMISRSSDLVKLPSIEQPSFESSATRSHVNAMRA